jgi:hypothetical protein
VEFDATAYMKHPLLVRMITEDERVELEAGIVSESMDKYGQALSLQAGKPVQAVG